MGKLSKLLRNPRLFFYDFFQKRVHKKKITESCESLHVEEKSVRKKYYAFHISAWKKDFIKSLYHDADVVFVPFAVEIKGSVQNVWKAKIIKDPHAEFIVWGKNLPRFAEVLGRNTEWMEDGFLRSVGLGSNHTLPYSITVDTKTNYFDSSRASDLENLLNTFDFNSEEGRSLLAYSRKVMSDLIKSGLSKYNNSLPVNIESLYGPKDRKRILVIGQVEDDASIKYGADRLYTNNDLVTIARLENPDAQIFYKPHPDVLCQKRPNLSNPEDVAHLCTIIDQDFPITQAFETIDHVYTITSGTGIEALIRGIKVTTLGMPFYAGWGLTDDRSCSKRRTRHLTIEELFAISYVKYPLYFNPFTKKKISIEEAICDLIILRDCYQKHLEGRNRTKELFVMES